MKYLSDYTQQAQTDLFDELGVFFAFSNQQFEEARKQDIEYVSLGMGMIVPENNAKSLVERLVEIQKEGIKQDIAENGKDAIIRRELFNHECFYTHDITDCVETLKEYGYSHDNIFQVYCDICQTEDIE
jgi:hypothetical protein